MQPNTFRNAPYLARDPEITLGRTLEPCGAHSMTEAYKLASKKSSEAVTRAKQRYDRFGRSSILLHGDRVLLRNLSERGGLGKLRSH